MLHQWVAIIKKISKHFILNKPKRKLMFYNNCCKFLTGNQWIKFLNSKLTTFGFYQVLLILKNFFNCRLIKTVNLPSMSIQVTGTRSTRKNCSTMIMFCFHYTTNIYLCEMVPTILHNPLFSFFFNHSASLLELFLTPHMDLKAN